MKKILAAVLFFFLISALCIAQDAGPLLESYLRNFARASVVTKTQVIQDAAAADLTKMGPLFKEAIDFVLTNHHLLDTDPSVQKLALLSAKYIGQAGYSGANYQLWDLFQIYRDSTLRVEILMALGETARGDDELIKMINQFLQNENSLYLTGMRIDRQVLAVCVIVLGKLKHPSSFPVLFTTKTIDHTDTITGYADDALANIEGDFKELMIAVIRQNSITEKLQGLEFALASSRLSDEEKGEVAEAALEAGLSTASPDSAETEVLRRLRYGAVRALTERQWTKALDLVIDNFEQSALEYDRGMTDITFFLAAINGLGAMRAHEAAERLTLYLGLLNSYTEGGQKVNEQIALTVINNLGMLGDQIAGDNLLFVAFVDYSDTVKQAAREAFKNLKRR